MFMSSSFQDQFIRVLLFKTLKKFPEHVLCSPGPVKNKEDTRSKASVILAQKSVHIRWTVTSLVKVRENDFEPRQL